MSTARCNRFSADVVGLLEGTADESLRGHVASCDACRDAAHSLERLAARIARAGDDFTVSPPLAERLAQIAEEEGSKASSSNDGDRISGERLRTEPPAAALPAKRERLAQRSKKSLWLLLAACASIGASAVVGIKLADHQRSPVVAATRAWHGKVAKVARGGADAAAEPGLSVVTASGAREPLVEGAEIKAGMHIATDGRTRARLWLDDGSIVVLDRATDITFESAPRTITVNDGAVLADVAHVDGAPWAKVKTPHGDVKVLGTKFAVTTAADRTNVEVLRGEVEVATGEGSRKVSAGQEGVVGKDGKVDVAPANDPRAARGVRRAAPLHAQRGRRGARERARRAPREAARPYRREGPGRCASSGTR